MTLHKNFQSNNYLVFVVFEGSQESNFHEIKFYFEQEIQSRRQIHRVLHVAQIK